MDLFNQTRKIIMKVISNEKSSASKIAKDIDMSLPYTLSQLAILEASGHITKEKTTKKAFGKPQLIYSISKSFLQLSVLTSNVGNIINFTGSQPLMENYLELIGSIPKSNISAFSEYYWKHSDQQKKISAIGLLSSATHTIEILAITQKEYLNELRRSISHFESKITGKTIKIVCWVHVIEEIIKGVENKDDYYNNLCLKVKPIIDPDNTFKEIKISCIKH